MAELITENAKRLYHYTDKNSAEEIMQDGFLKPPKDKRDYYVGFGISKIGIGIFRYDMNLDVKGNVRRRAKAPCIFLTESYPYYEMNVGVKWSANFAFPVSIGEIREQGFKVYRSHRIFSKNIYVVPDPDRRPLRIDVSKAIKLDWKWNAYAYFASPFVSPLQALWRLYESTVDIIKSERNH